MEFERFFKKETVKKVFFMQIFKKLSRDPKAQFLFQKYVIMSSFYKFVQVFQYYTVFQNF